MEKEKLVVNISGGRTSAYMAIKLWQNYRFKYELFFVFANTGKERPETLDFLNKVQTYFQIPITWLEGVYTLKKGKGASYKVVNYETADRSGATFEAMISKYGIPNVATPHCSGALKAHVISAWKRDNGLRKVNQAMGIRLDEIDRMRKSKLKFQFVYPLINWFPTKSSDVNWYWLDSPFDLNLKSYEGNCDLCFKKAQHKLLTIIDENPKLINWWQQMEAKYPGKVFNREYKSMHDLFKMSLKPFRRAFDTSKQIENVRQLEMLLNSDTEQNTCSESCEGFE